MRAWVLLRFLPTAVENDLYTSKDHLKMIIQTLWWRVRLAGLLACKQGMRHAVNRHNTEGSRHMFSTTGLGCVEDYLTVVVMSYIIAVVHTSP